MKKLLFIVNLKSGKSQIKPHFASIVDTFVVGGYDVHVHTTQAVKDAYKVAKNRGADFDVVVCSGGDGTLQEVISGLLTIQENRPPLGYIPAGTTNDFAKSLGIPSDMEKAAENVINGTPRLIDVGQFADRNFTYVAAFGAFTDVSYQTPQQMKNMLGHMAYIVEGLKSLPSITSYRMTVEFNDEIITDNFACGMVTNSVSVGGFKCISGKDMELDDGIYEVLLIRMPKNLLELKDILGAYLLQKVDERYMVYGKVKQIKFTSEEEVGWTLDGEDGGKHKVVELTNLHKAVGIICSADAKEIKDGIAQE